jgi:hypothetical protein
MTSKLAPEHHRVVLRTAEETDPSVKNAGSGVALAYD